MHAGAQPTATGYNGNRASPAAIAAAVGVHLAVAAIIMVMPGETYQKLKDGIIWAYPVPAEPEPQPPPPEAKAPPEPQQRTTVTVPAPLTPDLPVPAWNTIETGPVTLDPGLAGGLAGTGQIRAAEHKPIFVDARPDPSRMRDFQPDYPAAMIRQQVEGFARVRVHIAANGRVDSVDLIECTDEAFWKATREQALRRWRFMPATRDGIAIPADRVMTVRFRLSDLG